MSGTEANRLIEQHQRHPYPHDGLVRPTSCPICRARYLDDLARAHAADVLRVIRRWEVERCTVCADDVDGVCGWHWVFSNEPRP